MSSYCGKTKNHHPPLTTKIRAALALYDWIWMLGLPLLARHSRLKRDFHQRLGMTLPACVDLWIQAASAGEAYLALLLLEQLHCTIPIHALVTTNTRQGIQILEKASFLSDGSWLKGTLSIRYFPFDRPMIMQDVVETIRPKMVVFLETEIWPGLLAGLKQRQIPVCIVNGRISEKSFHRYMLWPAFWRSVGPDAVLAVSESDASRYGALFDPPQLGVMANMKFDRILEGEACHRVSASNPVRELIEPGTPFVVLGSVRQAEMDACMQMITQILAQKPEAVVGLFPRHMESVPFWSEALQKSTVTCRLRSRCHGRAAPGRVILWDIFGEMNQAFEVAQATFIGGSLAPLGGQNFLEALSHGVTPIIGPFWDDFHWVGRDIIEQGLVHQVHDWQDAAQQLIRLLGQPHHRMQIRTRACQYVQAHQGGTRQACGLIEYILNTN
jgi:3-deoxy-D-manno-octulosonic-acid transferase